MDGLSDLHSHMRYADLTVVAEDGTEYQAHKAIIAARCPMLEDKDIQQIEEGTLMIRRSEDVVSRFITHIYELEQPETEIEIGDTNEEIAEELVMHAGLICLARSYALHTLENEVRNLGGALINTTLSFTTSSAELLFVLRRLADEDGAGPFRELLVDLTQVKVEEEHEGLLQG